MGNFYDALRKAESERRGRGGGAEDPLAPRQGGDVDARVVAHVDKISPEMEQFRMLRTNILATDPAHPPRVIGVTSSIKKEGKSITSLNLATTFAEQRDTKVVVVDGDLRRPSLSEMLSVSGRFGLSHLLTRDLPLNKAVYETPIPKLHYIPAGDPTENPAELLGSKQMADLIDVLRAEFDFVVIDTPPILYVHDAGIVSTSVDGMVYVIKLGVTPRDRVTKGLEILERSRARMLGLVLTNVSRGHQTVSVSEYYSYSYQG